MTKEEEIPEKDAPLKENYDSLKRGYSSLADVYLSFTPEKDSEHEGIKNQITLQLKYNQELECFALYQVNNKLERIKFKQNIESEISDAFFKLKEKSFLKLKIPSHNKRHILLDARCLKALKEKRIISFEDESESKNSLLDDLASKEQKNQDIIWKEMGGGQESSICPNENRIYVTETGGQVKLATSIEDYILFVDIDQLQSLKGYLEGELFMRRKKKDLLNLPNSTWNKAPHRVRDFPNKVREKIGWKPRQAREFTLHNKSENGNLLIIDGADDLANALSSSGLPQQTIDLLQSLVIFPGFLSLVKLGVSGLSEEVEEKKAEIIELLEKISESKAAMEELEKSYKGDAKNYETNISDALHSIVELRKSMKDLKEGLQEAKSELCTSKCGKIAMLSMFLGVGCYELQSFINLCGGIDFLSKGAEGKELVHQLNIHGGALESQENISHAIGLFGIVGNGAIFGGQLLMTIFAARKSWEARKTSKEIATEIKTLKQSSLVSDKDFKEMLLAYRKLEKELAVRRLGGNGVLAAGQVTMALCGPMGFAFNPGVYAGLVATLAGIGINSYADIEEQNRIGRKERNNCLIIELMKRDTKGKYEFFKKVLDDETGKEKFFEDHQESIISKCNKATYLLLMPVIVSKIFSQVLCKGLTKDKAMELKQYNSRDYQKPLAKFAEELSEKTLENIKALFVEGKDELVRIKNFATWFYLTNELEPKEAHLHFLDKEKITNYEIADTFMNDAIAALNENTEYQEIKSTNHDAEIIKRILLEKILQSNLGKDFERILMNNLYDNAKKNDYLSEDNKTNPMQIVATVLKHNQGLLQKEFDPHEKHFYQLNKRYFESNLKDLKLDHFLKLMPIRKGESRAQFLGLLEYTNFIVNSEDSLALLEEARDEAIKEKDDKLNAGQLTVKEPSQKEHELSLEPAQEKSKANTPYQNTTFVKTMCDRKEIEASAMRLNNTEWKEKINIESLQVEILENINSAMGKLERKDSLNAFVPIVIRFAQEAGGVGNAGEVKWEEFIGRSKNKIPEGFSFLDAKKFSYHYQEAAKQSGIYTGRTENLKNTVEPIGARLKRIPEELNRFITENIGKGRAL